MWEDCGWIGVQNSKLLKKAAAELRMRGGDMNFQWAKGKEPGLVSALRNAEEGLRKPHAINLDLAIPINFEVAGVKLNAMMQALLYQGILEREKGYNNLP